MAEAPSILDFLEFESLQHFNTVKNSLADIGIQYEIDPKLVRGLDYYTHTTFEIISSKVGSQSALCGGGRYNLLAEQLGGPPTPAVGFAAGIERILLACKSEEVLEVEEKPIDIYIVRLEKELEAEVFNFAAKLRKKGKRLEFDYLARSVKAQMREANKFNSHYVIFY